MSDVRVAPTTTLLLTRPAHYQGLAECYQLLRYELPRDLPYLITDKNELWGKMQNILQAQIEHPYRVFYYDKLDGKQKWVVYVLLSKQNEPPVVTMPISSDAPLPWRRVSFEELDFHVLVKLLYVANMHGPHKGRFTGQGSCYIHAKKKGKTAHICAEIVISEDVQTEAIDLVRQFKIEAHATLFFKREKYPSGELSRYPAFGRRTAPNGAVYFLQLSPDEIIQAKSRKEPVFGQGPTKGGRTTLDYLDLDDLDASTGKILSDFISDFRAFLAQFGIESEPKTRAFQLFEAPKEKDLELDLTQLNPVGVFDHRKNKSLPLADFLKLFQKICPKNTFVELDCLHDQKRPVLILQDYQKDDFGNCNLFGNEEDPYATLYKERWDIPKQSLMVNFPTKARLAAKQEKNLTVEEYLAYSLPDETQLKRNLEVCLSQLYLKTLVCLHEPLAGRLPVLPPEFIYLRKFRNIPKLKIPFETMLYMKEDQLRFLDLRHLDQRMQAVELCEHLGVDLIECMEQMIQKYKREGRPEDERVPPSYNVIIGPNLFIEVEDCKERVLYNYQEMTRRQDAVKIVFPVEQFKLLEHYDEIKNKDQLPLEELLMRGLLDGKNPEPGREEDSLNFYHQLTNYDAYLDELQEEYPELSFEELTDDKKPFIHQIRYCLNIQPDKNGRFSNRQFIGYFQKLGRYLSDKGRDVHMYENIWSDDQYCYMVGAKDGIQRRQARAHIIRRFDVYQGREHFDIEVFLRMMSVQFVRAKQYTVLPYPFHLIDLYVENVLRFGGQ